MPRSRAPTRVDHDALQQPGAERKPISVASPQNGGRGAAGGGGAGAGAGAGAGSLGGSQRGKVVTVRVGAKAREAACEALTVPPTKDLGAAGPLRGFPSNTVTTSKYTKWNFLPKFLWEAYHHASNCYFTFDLAIQLIPGVTPTPPITTATPLLFVLGVSALREAVEDYARHKSDTATNSTEVEVLRDGTFRTVTCAQLRVGDIVKVRNGAEFPADIILISSSNEAGVCYDMTANLDGETNLKLHRVPEPTRKCVSDAQLWNLDAVYHFEAPNSRINSFSGQLVQSDGTVIPLVTKHLLLRGAMLQNTDWVTGVVTYTGKQTKLSLNQQPPRSRMSTLENLLNRYVILMFVLQTISCATLAGLSVWWANDYLDGAPYLGGFEFSSGIVLFFRNYGTWFILLALFIPISLFVTLEVVRFIQALFMRWDQLDPPEVTAELPWGIPAAATSSRFVRLMTAVNGIKPRTSSLNEDLARIQFVFSDKTGTLTANKMKFAQCYVAGGYAVYHEGTKPGSLATAMQDGGAEEGAAVRLFTRLLAVCNTVVPEWLNDNGKRLVYNSESTDELALVEAARNNGYKLVRRSLHGVELDLGFNSTTTAVLSASSSSPSSASATAGAGAGAASSRASSPAASAGAAAGAGVGSASSGPISPHRSGRGEAYKVLATLEFTSQRRRMSVLVRMPDGKLWLLSKGADLAIMERLASGQSAEVKHMNDVLSKWSSQGLRTLVMAGRELTRAECDAWLERYNEATAAIMARDARVAEVAEEIECNLKLLGATAIEDKLQDKVPDTIEYLRRAGMNVWVLTGDKRSTAISVAFSCRLISASTRLIKMKVASADEAATALDAALATVSGDKRGDSSSSSRSNRSNRGRGGDSGEEEEFGLVLDGRSLQYVLTRRFENRSKFLRLVAVCHSVVVCRATPLQKSDVVRTVQTELGQVTLAIGDGANDVSMIQQAHVGVGVLGREGTQAARSSDYAISQFRHLERLLAVHGRYSYVRIAQLVKYYFYKNLVFTLMQIFFAFSTGFTGQTLHDAWIITGYNMVFTAWPPVILGIFEKDISEASIHAHPSTYRHTQQGKPFRFVVFLLWLATGVLHAAIIYFGSMALFGTIPGVLDEAGNPVSLWGYSFMCSTVTVLVVSLKLAIMTKHWTIVNHVAVWGSLLLYAGIVWLYTAAGWVPAVLDVIVDAVLSPTGCFVVLILTAVPLLMDHYVAAWFQWFSPHDYDMLREVELLERRRSKRRVDAAKVAAGGDGAAGDDVRRASGSGGHHHTATPSDVAVTAFSGGHDDVHHTRRASGGSPGSGGAGGASRRSNGHHHINAGSPLTRAAASASASPSNYGSVSADVA